MIHLRGGYMESVCYSILIMNMVTPLIDRYVTNVPFGGGARHE
ncbi:MAG: RnfABCDGE type electron transport complex subunit D [Acidaminococcaceae bacterium]|nr:RnfABCDGE type electron transport complex subunit D [Acidaminococcaceae bacterium]